MSTSYGMLTSFDNDYQYVNTVGADVVFDAINDLLDRHNAVVNESMAVFVDRKTNLHKVRYYAPIGGEMQTVGRQAPAGAVKRTGHWDVAFPLIGSEDRLAKDRVDVGYMTAGQLESQIKSILDRDKNTVRRALLSALFINTARTFADKEWGNLTIQPLANGDATVYPPIIGAAAGAIDNHYVNGTLIQANFNTHLEELLEHYGWTQGGENVVCLCHPDEGATIAGFAAWNPYIDPKTLPSDAATWTNTVAGAPGVTVGSVSGCWINEWYWIPSGWIVFIHLGAPKPLYMREDPAGTGLGSGLQLLATETQYPIENAFYNHRFGFGAANRLNGIIWKVGAGPYTIPTTPIDYTFLRYGAAS